MGIRLRISFNDVFVVPLELTSKSESELYCITVKQDYTHILIPFFRYSAKGSVSSMAAVTKGTV